MICTLLAYVKLFIYIHIFSDKVFYIVVFQVVEMEIREAVEDVRIKGVIVQNIHLRVKDQETRGSTTSVRKLAKYAAQVKTAQCYQCH